MRFELVECGQLVLAQLVDLEEFIAYFGAQLQIAECVLLTEDRFEAVSVQFAGILRVAGGLLRRRRIRRGLVY